MAAYAVLAYSQGQGLGSMTVALIACDVTMPCNLWCMRLSHCVAGCKLVSICIVGDGFRIMAICADGIVQYACYKGEVALIYREVGMEFVCVYLVFMAEDTLRRVIVGVRKSQEYGTGISQR